MARSSAWIKVRPTLAGDKSSIRTGLELLQKRRPNSSPPERTRPTSDSGRNWIPSVDIESAVYPSHKKRDNRGYTREPVLFGTADLHPSRCALLRKNRRGRPHLHGSDVTEVI